MSKKSDNKFTRPTSPPPPLFLGKKERDFSKQIADEVTERLLAQQILYYAIDLNTSNYHPLYGETLNKSFLPPVLVKGIMVEWEGMQTETNNYGVDRKSSIVVHFHKRRISEDQNLVVRVGDFVRYGDLFYEIVETMENRPIFGQIEQFKVEVTAKCIRSRRDNFDSK